MEHTYENSGVHNDAKQDVSKILYEAAKQTWENRKGRFGEVLEFFPDFSGLRAVRVGGMPLDSLTNLGFDGVGTKVEVGERVGKHETVAFNLFSMVCDDAVVRGAEPVLLGSILDVNSLKDKNKVPFLKEVNALAKGYVDAAKAANVAVVNGEVAELGARVSGYGEFNYNWGAGVTWFGRESRMLKGNEIKVGDSVVALREKGFRSNGLSLVREVLTSHHGNRWHEVNTAGGNLGELVLEPSIIYTKAIVEMFGGFEGEPQAEIHGVAHITGGGIPEKLNRILRPSKLGASLTNLFAPAPIMMYVQGLGEVSDREAYCTWNMGPGMLVITPQPGKVIEIAKKNGIEAREAGEIIKDSGIVIKSQGVYAYREKYISF